jgi:colanic acid/amylovoran biosynthesis glycosyltransferase
VLRALESLDDEHEIRYRIAGDGPLRSDLESQVRESGLSDMVEFLGWKNSEGVAQLMAESDIFVQTSTTSSTGDKEGTPTVLLEAQARGLPVISTWHAGIPEIIDNCSSGLLVPERDSKAIKAALDHLLSEPSKRKELGQNGYELVKNQHSFSAVADVLEHMYQN